MKKLGFILGRRVDFRDGYVVLPPNPSISNLAIPDLRVYGTDKLYELGAKFYFNDKVFKYCRANSGGILRADSGAKNLNRIKVAYSALAEDALAGATQVKVTAGGIEKDDWKGGLIWMGHGVADGAKTQNRGIKGNSASVDGVVTVDLDFPLQITLTTSNYLELSASPYGNVAYALGAGTGSNQYASVVCVPCVYVAVTAYDYFWGQTWGPCWVCPGAAGFGAALEERMMCFDGYGHLIDLYQKLHTTGHAGQIAGFLMDATGPTSPEDIEEIFLMISP